MEDWLHLAIVEEAQLQHRDMTNRMRACRRDIRWGIDDPIDDVSDLEFRCLYRLPKAVVRTLVEDIRDVMPASTRITAISIESKVSNCQIKFLAG